MRTVIVRHWRWRPADPGDVVLIRAMDNVFNHRQVPFRGHANDRIVNFSQPIQTNHISIRVAKIRGTPTRLEARTLLQIAFDQAQDPERDAADLPSCKPRMNSAT